MKFVVAYGVFHILKSEGRQSTSPPGISHFSFLYSWDWWNSVLSVPQVPWGLAGLGYFSPQVYLADWRGSVILAPQAPCWGLGPSKRLVLASSLACVPRSGTVHSSSSTYLLYLQMSTWYRVARATSY